MTQTVSPNRISASSAPCSPVGIISLSITAETGSTFSGSRARFPSASFTWKSSAKTPSLMLENFHPASIPPECIENPPCASRLFQSGGDRGDDHPVPRLKIPNQSPCLHNLPDALVAEDHVMAFPHRALPYGVNVRGAGRDHQRAHKRVEGSALPGCPW